jgi:hypothetical protein
MTDEQKMGLYPIFLVCRKFETFGENVVLGNSSQPVVNPLPKKSWKWLPTVPK